MPIPDQGRTIDVDVEVESDVPPTQTPEDKATSEKHEKILKIARKRLRTGLAGWDRYRQDAQKCQRFCIGTWGEETFQWPEGFKAERNAEGRPCFTMNRMPTFLRLVSNQALQANLRILVKPVDERGDVKVAEILQGLIRNTEAVSMAARMYAKGSEKQAEQGLGYLKIDLEYADEGGEDIKNAFRQRPKLKGVRDPLRIIIDPAVEEPDFQDAMWGFELAACDPQTYLEKTGKEIAPTAETARSFGVDDAEIGDWFPNGKIVFAIYFSREIVGQKRLAKMDDGTIIELKTPAEDRKKLADAGVTILAERVVAVTKMFRRLITPIDVLDETEWVGKRIPWIPVLGRDVEHQGQRSFRGVTYDAIEPGQGYNVAVTNFMEAAAQGVKSPVVGFKGQFGKPNSAQRRAWENAHRKPVPFLELDLLDIQGSKEALRAQPVNFSVPIDGTVSMVQQFDNDLKNCAGWRDASLGERGPQESGVAIGERQKQDELQSSDYLDNLRWAMASVGKQLITIFRRLYTVAEIVRITGIDTKAKRTMVFSGEKNDPRKMPDPANPKAMIDDPSFQLPEGVDGIFDINAGEFDVEVTPGPDPGTQGDQEVRILGELMTKLPPEYMVNFLDLLFKAFPSSVGHEMAERAKKMLRPDLQTDEQGNPQGPSPEVQQMQQQMQQREQALMQALQEAHKVIETKQLDNQAKFHLKELDHFFKMMELLVKEENADRRIALEHEIGAAIRKLEHSMSGIDTSQGADQAAVAADADHARSVQLAQMPPPVDPNAQAAAAEEPAAPTEA